MNNFLLSFIPADRAQNIPRIEANADTWTALISGVLAIAGIVCIIAIILGGVRYATANGEPGNISTGKQVMIYAAVGLVVVISAFTIVQFVVRIGQG